VTLRNRIAVAAAVGVLVVVAVISGVVYVSYAASLRSRVDAALVDAAQQASAIARQVKRSAAVDGGARPDFSRPVAVGSIEIQLFTQRVTAGRPTRFGALDARDVAVADGAHPAFFADARSAGRRFRVYTSAFPDPRGDALVLASRAADADDAALRNAALLLAALTVAASAVTYVLARLSAGRILRPIGRLTAAAEHVTRTRDLTARLGATASTDEVGRLGSSFDTMLAALDESVTAQRQLVADASHELRTPLTSLTTNLDLLEDGAGLADPQAPALVRAAREQAGELGQLITDLLDLARYGESAPHRENVRLDLLTDESVQRMSPRMPCGAVVAVLHPCVAYVDPAGVDHAICNLIDNAIKWSRPDGAIRVVVQDGCVSVIDHGPGIPDADLPHIFERFYRAPAARGMPGAGLGLAIAARVAHANDASLDVRSGPDGSVFTLAFAPQPLP
jgi:two-component system sensor histidine kinase MprB